MSKKLIPVLLALGAASAVEAYDVTSKTHFTIRQPFQSSDPLKVSLFRERPHVLSDGWGGGGAFPQ